MSICFVISVIEFRILVELFAGTAAGSVIRCERFLEKSSSRPPPNSIFSEIVDIRIG